MSVVAPVVAPNYAPYYLYANAGLQYQDARLQFQKGHSFLGDEYGFRLNAGLQQLTNALQNDLTLIKRDNALIKERLNITA
jgi:hypothetical protein